MCTSQAFFKGEENPLKHKKHSMIIITFGLKLNHTSLHSLFGSKQPLINRPESLKSFTAEQRTKSIENKATESICEWPL